MSRTCVCGLCHLVLRTLSALSLCCVLALPLLGQAHSSFPFGSADADDEIVAMETDVTGHSYVLGWKSCAPRSITVPQPLKQRHSK